MKIHLHKNARTTPAQRQFIQDNRRMSTMTLAQRIGVSETTIRKWKKRSRILDNPHTPRKIFTALTPAQELMTVLIRVCLRSGLDDLLDILHRYILPGGSRSSLNRCLNRYNFSRLSPMHKGLPVNLKDYRGTYFYRVKIHLPINPVFLNPLTVETLLDCSFRWCYLKISPDHDQSSLPFIQQAVQDFPLRVMGIISENCTCLPDAGTIENLCQTRDMEFYQTRSIPRSTLDQAILTLQTLEPPCCPRANKDQPWDEAAIHQALVGYHQMPQRALGQKTPHQALTDHYKNFPNSFQHKPKQSYGTYRIIGCEA